MGRQGQTFSLSRHAKMFSVQHKILIWRENRNRTSRSSRSGVVHGSLVDDTHQSITPSTPISPPGTKRYSLEIIDSRTRGSQGGSKEGTSGKGMQASTDSSSSDGCIRQATTSHGGGMSRPAHWFRSSTIPTAPNTLTCQSFS